MRVRVLAQTTLREMLSEKVFSLVVFLAFFILLVSFALGALSFAEQKKILSDFGFLAIEISCLVTSAFFGSYLISREIEKQTCLLVLSRPVSRGRFIFAKYLGLMSLNLVIVGTLALVLAGLLQVWQQPGMFGNLLVVSLSIFMKAAILSALAFSFAQIVRPVISLLFVFVIYLLGHWIQDLRFLAEKSKDAATQMWIDLLDWLCPNFYKMNWKSWFFLENAPSSLEVSWAIVHSLGWILVLVVLMQVLFRRKDIV